MNNAIPDTSNGPLYQAWKRMRDEQIERERVVHAKFATIWTGIVAACKRANFSANETAPVVLPVRCRTKRGSVAGLVLNALNGHPVTTGEIIASTGGDLTHRTVNKTLQNLKQRGLATNPTRGLWLRTALTATGGGRE